MITYVALLRLTDGRRSQGQTPQELNSIREWVEQEGGKATLTLATAGRYDFVVVAEYPDPPTMIRARTRLLREGINAEFAEAFPASQLA